GRRPPRPARAPPPAPGRGAPPPPPGRAPRPRPGAVVEFGTRSLQMRPALRLDQWLRCKSPAAPDAARDAQLRADLVDAFVPVSSVWRRNVVAHGLQITRQAIAGLAAW
ncbi:DUF2817 domain-containing protein, partial [Achromobacter aegrifaciens]|uniref:DUF2817 domain-containing protein n=1 Tax=Achromobacter aegrifaciens TaxID=1287736 RepID=UPI001FCADA6A